MSDLAKRNAAAAESTLQRVDKQLGKLEAMIVAQNAKIQSLNEEVALLKQQLIMAAVKARIDATGNGGTA